MRHNESGAMAACCVEGGDENRVAAIPVNLSVTTDSSSVSRLHCWVTLHQNCLFHFHLSMFLFFHRVIFTLLHSSVLHLCLSCLSLFLSCTTSPCCCQFPDGRTWVVSPVRQRRKFQSRRPVSELVGEMFFVVV